MEDLSFLYGFFVGQVVLLLTLLFLLKNYVFSPVKTDKYTRIIVASQRIYGKNEMAKDDPLVFLSLINEFAKNIFTSLAFNTQLKAFMENVNFMLNEGLRESSLQGKIFLSQLLLEKAPHLTALNRANGAKSNDESFMAELECNAVGQIRAEGEVGTFGIYLPFLSIIQVEQISLAFEFSICNSIITLIVKRIEIAFDMDNTFGHPLQLKDTHKKIESLLKNYIYALLQSDILNKPFLFPIK
jgi:hypothetical protein